MKDLIIQALDKANDDLIRIVSTLTQIETKHFDITDVKPLELSKFIKQNNISNDCYFGGEFNDEGFSRYPTLCYDVKIPLNEKELNKEKVRRFDHIAFKEVMKVLESNGYIYNFKHGVIKPKNIYNLYLDKDFNSLETYYRQHFKHFTI